MVSCGTVNDGFSGPGAADAVEEQHAVRVSALALRLFDALQPLHRMGNTERIWLRAAALLHDVGKSEDPKRHHKVAFRTIRDCGELPFRREERLIVALVARYHRGPLPRRRHRYFGALAADEQRCVARLASLLRLADGLDKGRSCVVEDVSCEIRPVSVVLKVSSRNLLAVDKVLRKAELFEETFDKRVVIGVELDPYGAQFGLDPARGCVYAGSCDPS
jgi:exopolyphosphatase/guanosine-5'-triphosphate,3'-diphosphate pyrophosphatase